MALADSAELAASRIFHKNLMPTSQQTAAAPACISSFEARTILSIPFPAHDAPAPPSKPAARVVKPPPAVGPKLPRFKKSSSGGLSGKHPPPTPLELYRKQPQDLRRSYKTEASFGCILFFLVKHLWLKPHEDDVTDAEAALSSLSPEFEAIIFYVPTLLKINFSALRDPDPNYATRKEISKRLVWLMAACAVHYDLDFGLVLRYLAGEYTGEWRDVNQIVRNVSPYVSASDAEHIKRILSSGCPFEFNWEQTNENREVFLRRGNSPSIKANWGSVLKTLAKETRNKHLMVFPRWMVRGSPAGNHVPAHVVVRPGSSDRLIWNGSTKRAASETTMNEVTPTDREPEITFGHMYMAFIVWIWRLRISYPNEEILLAFLDISSCFRFPRIFADLVGAFGFVIGPWFFAPNAMVFGSVTSASSWEPFRRAIMGIALAGFFTACLVKKHKALLAMVRWAPPPPPDTRFIQAQECSRNRSIVNRDGSTEPTPHHIYVDDNLLADTPPPHAFYARCGHRGDF